MLDKCITLTTLTLTLTDAKRRCLDSAGARECQSLSLIDVDTRRRGGGAIDDLAKALWL